MKSLNSLVSQLKKEAPKHNWYRRSEAEKVKVEEYLK